MVDRMEVRYSFIPMKSTGMNMEATTTTTGLVPDTGWFVKLKPKTLLFSTVTLRPKDSLPTLLLHSRLQMFPLSLQHTYQDL